MELLISVLVVMAAIAVAIVALAKVEVAMVLFLTAPLVKLALMVAVPVAREYDYTAVVLIILGFSTLLYVARRGMEGNQLYGGFLAVLMGMLLVLAATFLYTPSPSYGLAKLTRILIVLPVSLMIPILYLRNVSQLRRLGVWTILIGLAVAIGTVLSPTPEYGPEMAGRGTFMDANPLSAAGTIVWGMLFAVVVGFDPSVRRLWRVLALLGLPVMLLGLFYTASRGPLLGLIACVLLFMWLRRRELGAAGWTMAVFWICVSIVALMAFLPEEYWRRFALIFGGSGSNSFGEDRFWLWREAWSHGWNSFLLGNGIGGFGYAMGFGDVRAYPHNILLEVFFEGGIIAALLLVALTIMTLIKVRSLLQLVKGSYLAPLAIGFVLMLTSSVFDALKSGDLSDNRRVWFWLGCILGMTNVVENLILQQQNDEYEAFLAAQRAMPSAAPAGAAMA